MKEHDSINSIISNNICTGCGICVDTCPQGAINFNEYKGKNVPFVIKSLCRSDKGCSLCYQICPGKGINLRQISLQLFKINNNFDYYLGYYKNLYAGYSEDDEIRHHSSSGGALSHFLIFLLNKRIINGAVITRFKPNNPIRTEAIIAKTNQEILSGRGSKYCPVSLNGIISKIQKFDGKCIIVGLPCHIHGFRMYERIDSKFKNKILGYFSIYCSSTRTYYGTKYILSHYRVKINELKYLFYREDGCPGFLKAITDDKVIKVPYREYYTKMRSFFKPKRCLFCVDHYGDLADMSFGDLQIGKYEKNKIEINSIISRNPYFDSLLNKANDEGFISISPINKTMLNLSQKAMLKHKRKLAGLHCYIEKKLSKFVPKYDINLPSDYNLSDFGIYIMIKIQRLIGQFKSLWFIIDIFNKIMEILFK